MDAERWRRVREVFDGAIEKAPSERDAYLEEACGGDPTLLGEVRSLLEASADAEAFLGGFAARAGLTLEREDRVEADAVGARFGPYRIVRLLGRGGMGAVYVAERDDDQFHMQVALKAIPGTVLTPDARARFLSERQILAGLHHPNIAQLLDGGVSDDGVPYFVMEYVDGRRIDDYCRDAELGVAERLQLFLQVCRGVQHAHGNLVVHRDLKPANILVTGDGVVKLLDFGIATMLESKAEFYQTAAHAPHPMTLAYASPQQVVGDRPTTACDVYGLGVLLYRLLADTHPYEFEPGSTYPKIQQVICERTPPPPSAALDPRVAAGRVVSRDLDAVTLKALAKEPARRYPTVADLAADLERYLEGRPVRARTPTAAYRLRRFVGRNRAVVGFGAAVAVLAISLLALGIRYATDTRAQAEALAQEVQTTQAVSDFLVGLFSAADPSEGGSDTISAGTLLARGLERAGAELQDVPLVRARVLRTLSGVYWGLGSPWIADSVGYEGLLVRRATLGPAHPETLDDALSLA
ncbi:MAG TPA: serine/threonine-protein kinase, partial [Longimicrobiales bacterium]|nr:serine/threonine-protein kinase [Longimicrobiales bacterium]